MAKAASNLGMSQPAVSEAIATLEAALGVQLLDRTRRGIEPTIYAVALLKHEHTVFDELRQGIKEIEHHWTLDLALSTKASLTSRASFLRPDVNAEYVVGDRSVERSPASLARAASTSRSS
jgi:DNA-binding transcriptional LysR family regulator